MFVRIYVDDILSLRYDHYITFIAHSLHDVHYVLVIVLNFDAGAVRCSTPVAQAKNLSVNSVVNPVRPLTVRFGIKNLRTDI